MRKRCVPAPCVLLLCLGACIHVTKPGWWNDEALLFLSGRVVVAAPGSDMTWTMRAEVLSCRGLTADRWHVGPRTEAQWVEAAVCFRRAANLAQLPRVIEQNLRQSDECIQVAKRLTKSTGNCVLAIVLVHPSTESVRVVLLINSDVQHGRVSLLPGCCFCR